MLNSLLSPSYSQAAKLLSEALFGPFYLIINNKKNAKSSSFCGERFILQNGNELKNKDW